jgi:hypothetical protein
MHFKRMAFFCVAFGIAMIYGFASYGISNKVRLMFEAIFMVSTVVAIVAVVSVIYYFAKKIARR